MFYNCKADYFHLTCQISSSSSLFPLSSHGTLPIIHIPSTPPSSRWSCPLAGFRLMTSDSPLRGASCLQSAVRLLVIIFQSVTLVSASWRWERRGDAGPRLAGYARGGDRVWCLVMGSVVFMCVYVCELKKWRWVEDTGCHCSLLFCLLGTWD